jgi:hypothetical protein
MIDQPVTRGGYDIGQLREWPLHSLPAGGVFRVRSRCEGERVERTGGGFKMPLRQVQVAAGGLQVCVAEQELNGV